MGRPGLFLVFGVLALERAAEDVAERRARVGGAVLGDGLLLFRDLQRLDRELGLAAAAVERDHAGIDLLADLEAVGTLVVAIAGKLGTLDEGVRSPPAIFTSMPASLTSVTSVVTTSPFSGRRPAPFGSP